jgi:frataxin-like iron-binding protein CyaY
MSCGQYSGPLRFEYHADSGEWRTTRDGRELFKLLASEVEQVTGVKLDLE